jgi:hypothetical protein
MEKEDDAFYKLNNALIDMIYDSLVKIKALESIIINEENEDEYRQKCIDLMPEINKIIVQSMHKNTGENIIKSIFDRQDD